jgi:rare lipoprotein A (peptidoglycan hydrolase)
MGRIGCLCSRNARMARDRFACPAAVSPTANPVGGDQEVIAYMLVAVPPTQPAVPLAADAIVEKVVLKRPRRAIRARAARHHAGRDTGYRLAGASWYGGGGSLACGGTLTSSTQGVANKTLPCGTVVFLRYRGRKVEVPVIDRGPFVAGREFDLTEATKRALGFGDTGEVWWRVR